MSVDGAAGSGDGAGAPEREPLLLVHGLGAASHVWDPVVPLLSPHREVIALDMPGFGTEPALPPEVEPTAAALAANLRDRLAARGVERAHVAGNSLGAWVGLEMGRMGAARSVTCLSPAGLWRAPIGPRKGSGRKWAKRLRPVVSAALWIGPVRDRVVATFAARPENWPTRAARELVLAWIDSEGYDGANKAMREHIFVTDGYPADVPVTIAWAELDKQVGPPKPERRPAGTKFLVLPEVGHVPMWDDPELIAQTILDGTRPASFRA